MPGSIVIVGGGECGGRAALALRAEGYDGPITLIGAEPHLPYERPPLSKAALAADGDPPPIADEDGFARAGITLWRGVEAAAIDRTARAVVTADGRAVTYDRLLLATGSRPRRLAAAGVLHVRSLEESRALRARLSPGARLVVIGGGFLGLEIAAAARARGAEVVVLETQPRILMRGVPDEIAAVIAARHARDGVAIRTGVAIASVAENGVALATGETLAADAVVAAIGAVPNAELAAAAGLAVENGIRVDATLATSDPAIFAAGDCCAFPLPLCDGRHVRLESWRNAGEQAALAARNLLGAGETVSAVPWFWSDQYELTLQVAGLWEPGLATVRRDLGEEAFVLFHLAPDGRLVAASGIGREGRIARDIKLAEMLIARRARPDATALAAPEVKLKSLLAQ